MRMLTASLMVFASGIVIINAVADHKNKQEVLSEYQPYEASDIDPLWDCDLPNCKFNLCQEALRYSDPNCIKSIHSLTNGDWYVIYATSSQ